MMKKAIAILLSMVMILSIAACGSSAGSTEQPYSEEKSEGESAGDVVNSVENSADNELDSVENSHNGDTESTDNEETQQDEAKTAEAQGVKVLVAYFSATNTTKGVAEHIANGLQADIYEIVPEEPYTDADLNYNDNSSRTTIEMNDSDVRPGISGSVENMEQYDIVFIGYAAGIIGLN